MEMLGQSDVAGVLSGSKEESRNRMMGGQASVDFDTGTYIK